jgi:hypothetical protein
MRATKKVLSFHYQIFSLVTNTNVCKHSTFPVTCEQRMKGLFRTRILY